MNRFFFVISTFLTGFLLYSAWAGYIEEEFKITEYKGLVAYKFQSEKVIDLGTAMTINPQYKIVFSTGKVLIVPYPIYHKVNKGEYTTLLEQNGRIIFP